MRQPIRILIVLSIYVAAAGGGVTQLKGATPGSRSVELKTRSMAGQALRVTMSYEVAGSLALPGKDAAESKALPLAVNASARFDERILDMDISAARDQEFGQRAQRRSVRHYDQLTAKLVVNGQKTEPSLRDVQRLTVAAVRDGSLTLFSPRAPLTREELDLMRWPGDSLTADLLLPQQQARVGSKWRVDDTSLALLLGMESVGQSDVNGVLKEVSSRYAIVEADGIVNGVADGAATRVEIKTRCHFDLRHRMVTSLQMITREKRQVGDVTPGVNAVAKTKVSLTPIQKSAALTDLALKGLRLTPRPETTRLSFHSETGRFGVLHDREWYITADDKFASVMRKIEDGQLIAQCNVTALPEVDKGKEVTLERFQDDVRSTLGDHFGRFVKAGQTVDSQGRLVYRVEAQGEVAKVPVRWLYYLLSRPDGRRAAFVFTLEESLVERFGRADQQILAGFQFAGSPSEPETAESVSTERDGSASPSAKSEQPAEQSAAKKQPVDRTSRAGASRRR